MPTRRLALAGVAAAGGLIVVAALVARPFAAPSPAPSASPSIALAPSADPSPSPSPRPAPGHEIYGYIPYWEMDATIADHLGRTPLTTVGLFSVTNTSKGAIDRAQNGYKRIDGPVGDRMIAAARKAGMRIELVFTSFGEARNTKFFNDLTLQDKTIGSVAKLAADLRLDGVNVDVEGLDPALIDAYGDFVGRMRAAVVKADPEDQVSVATTANTTGAAMAAAAAEAGADRIFLMGYDYHWAGSAPGASSPLDRRDGNEKDLSWSLDLYELAGVPVQRTILGLPLYGMFWPVTGPEIGAPNTDRGDAWVPRRNLDFLKDPDHVPVRDEIEGVEVYSVPSGNDDAQTWQALYLDSPETLAMKLALANERGLLGGGFWAIGYERGLPGYTDLMKRFAAGEPMS